MNTKMAVAIVVLVAVAMLLVIAIALGANHPRRPSAGIEDALRKLRSDRFLRLEGDVVATCNTAGPTAVVVGPGGTCTITIPKGGLVSRPTRIVLSSASQVELALDPDRGPALTMTLKPGKCTEAAVGRGGGTITLAGCPGPGACGVALLDRGCRDEG